MSDIRRIRGWRQSTANTAAYERLLGAMGTRDFGATVREAVLKVTPATRRIYLFEATGREHSSLEYYHGEPGLADLFPDYRRWYLRLDPVSDAYPEAPELGDVAVQRVRPRHIASVGFRRRIFDDAGIVERISVIQRGAGAWRVMNVARHSSDGFFSDGEVDALVGLACLVLPMLPLNRERQAPPAQLTVAELELRFAERFGSLTRRECQVCARAALGMSVEAAALDLRIAGSTVLTYRKRAYQRLDVASPVELCALIAH